MHAHTSNTHTRLCVPSHPASVLLAVVATASPKGHTFADRNVWGSNALSICGNEACHVAQRVILTCLLTCERRRRRYRRCSHESCPANRANTSRTAILSAELEAIATADISLRLEASYQWNWKCLLVAS
jgi:hypothetical protein